MAITPQQQITLMLVHARQVERMTDTIPLLSPAELHAFKGAVAAVNDSIAAEEQRRARVRVELAAPAAKPHYGRGQTKLSDDEVRAIHQAYAAAGGASNRRIIGQLAKRHGVNYSTVHAIVTGKIRTDVV